MRRTLVLARTTQPSEPEPSLSEPISAEQNNINYHDELVEDFDASRPGISIPIQDEEKDDNLWAAPPRLSLPLEVEFRLDRSVEKARRADSAHFENRLSRGSLGDLRTSDHFLEPSELYSEATDDPLAEQMHHGDKDGDMLEEAESPLGSRLATAFGSGFRRLTDAVKMPKNRRRKYLQTRSLVNLISKTIAEEKASTT